jgi:hypothetical protein
VLVRMFLDQFGEGFVVGIGRKSWKVVTDVKPGRPRFEIDVCPGRLIEFVVQARNDKTKNGGLRWEIADRGGASSAEMTNRAHRGLEDRGLVGFIAPLERCSRHHGDRRKGRAMNPSTERTMTVPDRTEGPIRLVAQGPT